MDPSDDPLLAEKGRFIDCIFYEMSEAFCYRPAALLDVPLLYEGMPLQHGGMKVKIKWNRVVDIPCWDTLCKTTGQASNIPS